MDRIKMREKLEKKLDKKRFEHSLGVSYTAACLAMRYGVNVEDATVAGLLHDCAKGFTATEKLEKCEKHHLPVNAFERKNPELLHAKLSAYYAKEKYDVTNPEILSAITWHTTGKADMTTLEKIIYIADYIEPNRKMLKDMDELRREAFVDLDTCLIHILKNTLAYLDNKGADMIEPTTMETFRFYVGGEEE